MRKAPTPRIQSFADGVDKTVRMIPLAVQEETDWAVIRLVFAVNLSLNDGLQTKSPDREFTQEEKQERLSVLTKKFDVSEREVRTLAKYPLLCNSGTITRAGLHYILKDSESVGDSIDRLFRGGLITQRMTKYFAFTKEFGAIYPTKLGDRFLKNMYDIFKPNKLGIPPGVDPGLEK